MRQQPVSMRDTGVVSMRDPIVVPDATAGDYAIDLITSIPQAGLKAAGGIVNYLEASERTLLEYIYRDLSPEEKAAKIKYLEENQEFGFLSEGDDNVFSNAARYFDRFDVKAEQSITEDLEDGNYARAGARAVVAGVESWPSIMAAYMGAPAMIALGVSYAGNKFEEEFEKNPEASMANLFVNATGTGAIEAGFEMATRGLLKYAGFLGEAPAKALIKGGMIELGKKLTFGFVGEGLSEAATEVTNNIWDSMTIEGREMPTFAQMKYQLGDAFIVGGLVGGTISGIGEINSRSKAAGDRATITLMPLEEKEKFNQGVKSLRNLYSDRRKAKTDEAREIIDQEILQQTRIVEGIKNETKASLENLNSKDIKTYSENVVEINKLLAQARENSNNQTIQKVNGKKIREINAQNKNLLRTSKADLVEKSKQGVRKYIEEGKLDGTITELNSTEIAENLLEEQAILRAEIEGERSKQDANQQKIQSLEQQLNELDQADNEFGFIKQYADGAFDIIINKDKPMVGTTGHEFMHAVLFKTLKNNSALQTALGDALIDHTQKLGGETSILADRLSAYGRFNENNVFERADNFGEETITIMSESIIDGQLDFDEGLFTKVRDAIRRFAQKLGAEITFDSGRDVYNFVKDYSKSIKEGKVDKAILKVAREGAKGRLLEVDATPQPGIAFSKEASDNVQRIYEEQGIGGALDIINQFKPIVNKIVDKRKEAPNFDRQLLTDEIETGQRGILDLIREYKPESGVPLAAYINKFLPARAIEASRRVLGEEFTEDVTEARGVTAEETTEVEVQAKPRKKKTVLAKRLGVSDKAIKAIKKILPDLDTSNLTFKSLKNQVPDIVGELFGISPKKIVSKANITKGELLSSQMFINKNADLLMAMLPEGATPSGTATGVPKTLLDAFYTKTDRAKAATTGSRAGLAIQRKNKIDKTQFLETFGIIEGKPVRTDRNTSARVLALADMVGKMITNQTVRQELAKQPGKEQDITRIAEGKSEIMFSRQNKASIITAKIKDYISKNYFDNLIKQGINEGVKIPRDKVLFEKIEEGEVVSEVVDMKQMQALVPGLNITYERYFANKIISFLGSYPKYYDLVKEYFTGGVKKSAFISVDYFESLIPVSIKKGVDQVIAKRNPYNVASPKGEKGKRQNKNIANQDLSRDNNKVDNLIEFAKDIEAYLKINPNDADLFVELKKHGSIDQNNFGRKSFPFEFHAVDANEKPILNQPVVEEHTPQAEVLNILFGAAMDLNNSVDNVIPVIRVLASQGSVLKEDDPIGPLKESMGKDFFDKVVPRILNGQLDPSLMASYGFIYRLMKAGVDPNRYVLNRAKQTIAKFLGVHKLSVEDAQQSIIDVFEGNVNKEFLVSYSKIPLKNNIKESTKLLKAINKARVNKESKGITILDFDDTLATTKSLVKYTSPDGTTGTLNAEEYAKNYQELQQQGYTFDFSEFNKVVNGKIAPLFQKALKLQGKFGPENMFVLTARPPQAQKAIFDFLKANGLNIPLKNITGLANSTPEAKALWIAEKVGEGYNDFYFADDALQNVQAVDNMLEQFDVKRKVQQAKIQFSKDLNTEFNDILENITGIESKKRFAATKARKRGANKGKFRFFIPPSHEDFVGLLYNFMGKGRIGDAHRDFFEKALVRPLLRAHREIDTAKQAVANDYKALNKQMPEVRKMLTKKTPDGDFTYQDAIRVYIWNKHGYTIPGLSDIDQKDLVDLVRKDPDLQAYAETINTISKQDAYVDPGPNWETGNIRIDLVDATGRVGRKSYFTEFQENADIIFSEQNLNKIEAGYGKDLREALEDMLHRIKTGVNRPKGASAKPNMFMNWLNASVSGVMFFNTRSSILQQMSNVNYLNFADNNILAAGKAFANQPQYWKDFAMIFNSDMLKQRRGGLQTDINGAELAEAIKKARPGNLFDQVAIIIGKALKLGFLPTQIGDNIAIATGGAAFYRNRVNKYIKDGLPIDQAEKKAFNDFQDITQSTQQSAKPYMTSAQQAMWIGKLVLNFLNTPSQYNRIIKKAGSDIKNRRITPPNTTQMQSDMSNMSRILYYGAAQNLIFYSLQTALFAVMFGGEDEDEDERIVQLLKKKERVINGTIDTILRGSGIYGVAVSTLKNMAIKFMEQRVKGYNKDEAAVVMELLNFSPVVGIKARRIVNAEKTLNYNMKVIKEMETFDIDNPMWSAVTNYTQTITTAPTNKIYQKVINLRNAADNDYTLLQRILFFSGYTTWSLGLGDTKKMKEIKEKVKSKSKSKSKKTKSLRNTKKSLRTSEKSLR